MESTSFERLVSAIAMVQGIPRTKGHFSVAQAPSPFAAPPLLFEKDEQGDPFAAEVLLIKASAAVGKSVMAKYLSASCKAPLLDLALVPVSTGTLKALVSDMDGTDNPIAAFHEGRLPIIVDALDEGRLLSSETGYEAFLRTAGELLLQDRSVTNRPKLIFFGRNDSTEDAETWLALAAEEVTVRTIGVGYFGEEAARKLIDAYALANAPDDAAYRKHTEPAHRLVDAYFDAIEAAVGSPRGRLWSDTQGRSFAGYAPILAALGSLLSRIDNFTEVANRLASQGRQEAWGVIGTVLDEILKREKQKLCEKLETQLGCPVPSEAYDAREQLTSLAGLFHGQRPGSSSRVKLPPTEQVKYNTMVQQIISEHPFVRQGRPTNDVLGSMVLAHAITNDLLKNCNRELVATLSQQPFVWRFIRTQLEDTSDTLIDGDFLGYILNSYWNDPNAPEGEISIRSNEESGVSVSIPTGQGVFSFTTIAPLHLYAQMRNCDIHIEDSILLEGRSAKGTSSALYMHGRSSLVTESLEVIADTLTIDGSLWMEAEVVKSTPRLDLRLKKGAEVGWGGKLAESYPWSRVPSTRLPLPHDDGSDVLAISAHRDCPTVS